MTRYFTARRHSEYFVAVPTRAAIHIQNKAPGPPATRAVATPTILPVPIVADKAVQSEAKPDTSPSPDASFFTVCLMASPSFVICSPFRRIVRNKPTEIIRIIRGSPQTKLSIVLRIELKLSNINKSLRSKMIFS